MLATYKNIVLKKKKKSLVESQFVARWDWALLIFLGFKAQQVAAYTPTKIIFFIINTNKFIIILTQNNIE